MFLRRFMGTIKGQVRDLNWFMVVLDFVIVVVGVLLAFQITNWNDGRKARAQLAEAETAIKYDLFFNYVYAQERMSLQTCRVERLAALIKQLEEPGGMWTGMPFGDASDRAIAPVFRTPYRPWAGGLWNAELARGTLSGMKVSERQNLDFIFKQSAGVEAQQHQITDLAMRLKTLSHSMQLSHEDRLRYLDVVAQIDGISFWAELGASQVCAAIEDLGLKYDADEQKDLLAQVQSAIDLKLHRKQYGECAKPVVIAIFNDPKSGSGKKSLCSSTPYN